MAEWQEHITSLCLNISQIVVIHQRFRREETKEVLKKEPKSQTG